MIKIGFKHLGFFPSQIMSLEFKDFKFYFCLDLKDIH